jgi:hypothetical protein
MSLPEELATGSGMECRSRSGIEYSAGYIRTSKTPDSRSLVSAWSDYSMTEVAYREEAGEILPLDEARASGIEFRPKFLEGP